MSSGNRGTVADRLYAWLADERGERNCTAITADACPLVPRNFFLILASNSLTKIGDQLASPKTTLAWLLPSLGAPAYLIGLLVPLRESGSMLPQLFIAVLVRRLSIRKWVWVVGSVLEGLAIMAIGLVALTMTGASAGWTLIALLALFSLARAFSSVVAKDVMGKTIPKSRRGLLNGWMGAVSGLLTIAGGAAFFAQSSTSGGEESAAQFAVFLFVAGALWLVGGAIYSAVRELPGEADRAPTGLGAALSKLRLLVDDAPFRRFVLVRALAIGSGMAAPFMIALAHSQLGGAAIWLGVFIVVDGFAAMVSGPFWGRFSDRSSKRVLLMAMGISGVLSAGVAAWSLLDAPTLAHQIVYPAAFLLLGIAHSGVRIGRKTYLVDMAEGNKRTDYVATSNTAIGVLLLLAGAASGFLALFSIQAVLLGFALAAGWGMLLGRELKDVSG